MTSIPPSPRQILAHPIIGRAVVLNGLLALLVVAASAMLLMPELESTIVSHALLQKYAAGLMVAWLLSVAGTLFFLPKKYLNTKPEEEWLAEMQRDFADATVVVSRGNAHRFETAGIAGESLATGKSNAQETRCCIFIADKSYDISRKAEDDPSGGTQQVLRIYASQDAPGETSTPLIMFHCAKNNRSMHTVSLKGVRSIEIRPKPPLAFPESYDIVIEGQVKGRMQRRVWGDPVCALAISDLPESVCAMLASCCLLSNCKPGG